MKTSREYTKKLQEVVRVAEENQRKEHFAEGKSGGNRDDDYQDFQHKAASKIGGLIGAPTTKKEDMKEKIEEVEEVEVFDTTLGARIVSIATKLSIPLNNFRPIAR